MQIQVINFEVCKNHYVITRMIKTTSKNRIEYVPYHCYKQSFADGYILISVTRENELIDWCQINDIPLEKTVVISNQSLKQFLHWEGINLFDKSLGFEKLCQYLMIVREKSPEIDIFENRTIKSGKIRKEREMEDCIQLILKQNLGLSKQALILLFVKEKNPMQLDESKSMKNKVLQYYVKGISETYDYLIIQNK